MSDEKKAADGIDKYCDALAKDWAMSAENPPAVRAVPREPTGRMLQRFTDVWPDGQHTKDDIRKAWRAMYDAAVSPATPGADDPRKPEYYSPELTVALQVVKSQAEAITRLRTELADMTRERDGWRSRAEGWKNDAGDARLEVEQLRRELDASRIALDDWLNTYAADMCGEDRVKEAHKRIWDSGGTLAYIAAQQARNRAALSGRQQEKQEPCPKCQRVECQCVRMEMQKR